MPPLGSYFGSYTITGYDGHDPLAGLMKENEILTIGPDGNGGATLSWGNPSNSLKLQWRSLDGGVLIAEPAQLTEHGTLEVPLKSAGVQMTKPGDLTGGLQPPKGDASKFTATRAGQ